jgi:adenylate cyclase
MIARGILQVLRFLTAADPAVERSQALRYGLPPEVRCLAVVALTLWCLGYPTQAVRRSQEALALARMLTPPQSLTSRAWLDVACSLAA